MDSGERDLLSVRDLRVAFQVGGQAGLAVAGVTFAVRRGESVGLVGESGSGKSVTAMSIVGLLPKTATVTGSVEFDGVDLLSLAPRALREYRWKRIGMILQDPLAVLNPVFTIGRQLAEPLRIRRGLRGEQLRSRCIELLRLMDIRSAEERLKSFPHQLSGGMQQRVVGAIALAGEPDLLIADEPTTALDATIEASYLRLLRNIRESTGLSLLFISHDLSLVSSLCDRVIVMYAGAIVEDGPAREVLSTPSHPYTRALLEAIPSLQRRHERLPVVPGIAPSIFASRTGCPFRTRCSRYIQLDRPTVCAESMPVMQPSQAGHGSACHFPLLTNTGDYTDDHREHRITPNVGE